MSLRPFRFLHASDFHLEQPLCGVPEVPDHLREAFIDAPYAAAERIFQAALDEAVDFVVLVGDILEAQHGGPAALEFLRQQFGRLHDRGIPVYWAGGQVDPPQRWPAEVPLPESVHVFPAGRLSEMAVTRDGQTIAVVAGQSFDGGRDIRAEDYRADRGEPFRIALAFGNASGETLAEQRVDYWALGGRHERTVVTSTPQTAHYCGTPQGRHPGETGAHGCTLVHVEADGSVRTQLLATDVLRWHHERIDLSDTATEADLRTAWRDRVAKLRQTVTDQHLLVKWTVATDSSLGQRLRRGQQADEMTRWLRQEFGSVGSDRSDRSENPSVWTVSIESEPLTWQQDWFEENTILGEFLRIVKGFQTELDRPLGIEAYLNDAHVPDDIATAVSLSDPAERRQILRQVAMLGVDLLGGTEPAENVETTA